MARLRFAVGRQSLGRNVRPSEAGYTRAVRAQMDQIIKNMKKTIKAIEMSSIGGVEYALQPIYDTSQELCPVKTGRLKNSGYIEARLGSRRISGIVAYAKGGNPHYGVFVHERLDIPHAPPTQAKFLEEAVNRHSDEIIPRYVEFVRGNVGL